MATRAVERSDEHRELIRQAVEGGTGEVESLGRFIDNLLGDARIRKNAKRHVAAWRTQLNSESTGAEPLPDPEPMALPPPMH